MAKRTSAASPSPAEAEPQDAADGIMADSPEDLFGTPAKTADQDGESTETDSTEEPEATGDEEAKSPELAQPTADSKDKGATEPPKPDKVFTLHGERFTAKQLAERIAANPDLAEDLTQTYNQLPALQRKHLELLEAMRGAPKPGEATKADPNTAPAAPAMSKDEALKVFSDANKPVLEHLVAQGLMSEDFVDVNPAEARLLAHNTAKTQATEARLNQFMADAQDFVQKLIFPMFEAARQAAETNERQVRDTALDARLATLSGSHEALAPLSDPEVRSSYVRQLRATVQVDDDAKMDDAFLRGQFLAFQADPFLQAAVEIAKVRERQKARETRTVAGDAGSAGRAKPPASSGNQDIMEFFGKG